MEKKYPILKVSEESLDSDTACEDGVDDEDSNTTLQLGYYIIIISFLELVFLLLMYMFCWLNISHALSFLKLQLKT